MPSSLNPLTLQPFDAILRDMKVEEIAEAVAKLPAGLEFDEPPAETGELIRRTDHAEELDSTAIAHD
jgi:hypothetical protein